MRKLSEKIQSKVGIIILAIIVVGLIAIISFELSDNSTTNKVDVNKTEDKAASFDLHKNEESSLNPKPEIKPVENVPQEVDKNIVPQENTHLLESKQNEAPIKSIQEGQPKVVNSPTPPPKPVPQGDVTDIAVKPTYKDQNVKPQQSQPKMGDKNDKGQIYIEGFGWVKDEGGGGKGTAVGKQGDQLTGNKVGTMD